MSHVILPTCGWWDQTSLAQRCWGSRPGHSCPVAGLCPHPQLWLWKACSGSEMIENFLEMLPPLFVNLPSGWQCQSPS